MSGQFEDQMQKMVEICADLRKQNTPGELVESFQRANGILPLSMEDKAIHLVPVAEYLAERLEVLEKNPKRIRSDKLFPKSLVARVVSMMIEILGGRLDLLPSVIPIIDTLMDVKHKPLSASRSLEARKMAVYIRALFPDTSASKISKTVGVGTSTVSRWLKTSEFQEDVELYHKLAKDPRALEMLKSALAFTHLESQQKK
jgi:hypothetical protein